MLLRGQDDTMTRTHDCNRVTAYTVGSQDIMPCKKCVRRRCSCKPGQWRSDVMTAYCALCGRSRPRLSTMAQVRRTITEFLDSKGLFRGTADNKMSLGLCSRSKDVIEPLMRPQWWVDCKQMAAAGCAAVRNGDMQILPAECETTWFRCRRCLSPQQTFSHQCRMC